MTAAAAVAGHARTGKPVVRMENALHLPAGTEPAMRVRIVTPVLMIADAERVKFVLQWENVRIVRPKATPLPLAWVDVVKA